MHSLELQELQKSNYKVQAIQVLVAVSAKVLMAHDVESTQLLLLSKK